MDGEQVSFERELQLSVRQSPVELALVFATAALILIFCGEAFKTCRPAAYATLRRELAEEGRNLRWDLDAAAATFARPSSRSLEGLLDAASWEARSELLTRKLAGQHAARFVDLLGENQAKLR